MKTFISSINFTDIPYASRLSPKAQEAVLKSTNLYIGLLLKKACYIEGNDTGHSPNSEINAVHIQNAQKMLMPDYQGTYPKARALLKVLSYLLNLGISLCISFKNFLFPYTWLAIIILICLLLLVNIILNTVVHK